VRGPEPTGEAGIPVQVKLPAPALDSCGVRPAPDGLLAGCLLWATGLAAACLAPTQPVGPDPCADAYPSAYQTCLRVTEPCLPDAGEPCMDQVDLCSARACNALQSCCLNALTPSEACAPGCPVQ
jgi:hypothetical protein